MEVVVSMVVWVTADGGVDRDKGRGLLLERGPVPEASLPGRETA